MQDERLVVCEAEMQARNKIINLIVLLTLMRMPCNKVPRLGVLACLARIRK